MSLCGSASSSITTTTLDVIDGPVERIIELSSSPKRSSIVSKKSDIKNTTKIHAQINVFCRFRPPSKSGGYGKLIKRRNRSYSPGDKPERNAAHISQNFLFSKDNSTIRFCENYSSEFQDFMFDKVFQPTIAQKEIYETSVKALVEEVVNGFNCTAFAYGQTGSGKTYTVLGESKLLEEQELSKKAGFISRAALDLFELTEDSETKIYFSAMEIYLEKVRDLLPNTWSGTGQYEALRIRQTNEGGVSVEGVSEVRVSSAEALINLVDKASRRRVTCSTFMNQDSSRSHAIYEISLRNPKTSSKLVFVDLAGSEINKRTGASAIILEEAKNINKSLSALGNVVKALVENKSHIPYRDSKLTRLLQSSLGGNSKTSFILTCSPSTFDVAETVSTLRFGKRAKSVVNAPVVNPSAQAESQNIVKLKERESQLTKTIITMKAQLSHLEEENMKLLEIKVDDEVRMEHLQERSELLEKGNTGLMEEVINLKEQLQLLKDEKDKVQNEMKVEETRSYHINIKSNSLSENTGSQALSYPFVGEKIECSFDEAKPLEVDSSDLCDETIAVGSQSLLANIPVTKVSKDEVIHFSKLWHDVRPKSNSLPMALKLESASDKFGSRDSGVEQTLVEMTKRLLEMRSELGRKTAELAYANKLLQGSHKKQLNIGFLKTTGGSTVDTQDFLEVIKRKDESITENIEQLHQVKIQLNYLNTRCSTLEVEKKSLKSKVMSRESHIRFLQETLQEYQNPGEIVKSVDC